jgi:hypothetical protein
MNLCRGLSAVQRRCQPTFARGWRGDGGPTGQAQGRSPCTWPAPSWSGCRDLNPGPLDPQVNARVRCAGASFPRLNLSAISKVKWSPNGRSHFSEAGASFQDVSDMFGHTDTPMLVKHYRQQRGVVDLTEGQSRMFGSA